ncbi:MAG: para-aminobenzoate synthetase component 1 [Brevundimonas sp.]|jgi:para-aminobenzoate synthetase component 1|uniref:anthranilate synthase component I family protein n=1 Tax=Brevundimonas sp. TaxID=1871086 RepID=UPI0039E5DC10
MPGPVLTLIERDWVPPLHAAAGLEAREGRLVLLSDGAPDARWSYAAAEPAAIERIPRGQGDPFERIAALLGERAEPAPGAPPFTGGVVGLAAYDLAAPEAVLGGDDQDWPGLTLARYEAVLAFDHRERRVIAVGRGADDRAARAAAEQASAWLASARAPRGLSGPLAEDFAPERPAQAYVDAVSDVVGRIAAGEIFQANIARAWSGVLVEEADPFDLFARMAGASPAPYAAFWDLGDHVLASNSPESFLSLRDGWITARPIKGTRRRGANPRQDAAMKAELLASAKDRAENLMIVDLMRNDLSRVCVPGSVTAPALFELQTFANVHHLVSTVQGRPAPGVGSAEIMAATFPPGSITGAPKHQAMQVIARHEAARGPWCGSLFTAGFDGSLEASVLIRTVALHRTGGRWCFRTLAGAGIVADSDPEAELAETDAKITAIRAAIMDQAARSAL